ncbi:MAG: amino acid adenylation domain-containing protein [Myxacorys chilensis ATA2-1-KO14]|jgi:amino acid adenylation domain-containing protein/natural product biosynthesis luciferase-like monooxygenase protein/non-ribosomal peptide synthase protein (TIGR01720 family)|nr:amino acid adenylation domain-containing protein [Myxacorys chilensis ATA2-1-KO14]
MAKRLVLELETLAIAMKSSPGAPLFNITFWNPEHAKADQDRLNQESVIAASVEPLHQIIATTAIQYPNRSAVEDSQYKLTYAQLDARATAIAANLKMMGGGPGVVVALYMGRSVCALIAILGILKAGAAFLPLSEEDPPARIAWQLDDVRAGLVIAIDRGLAVPDYLAGRPCLLLDQETGLPLSFAPVLALSPSVPANTAYVLYTSGTTGRPKGVIVPESALANYCVWAAHFYHIARGNGAVVSSSLTVDLTLTTLLAPLVVGQRVIMAALDDPLADLAARLTERTDLSLVKLTPSQFALINARLHGTPPAGAVRTIVLGGEVLGGDLILPWRKHAPKTLIWNEYGPTETTVGCTVFAATGDETVIPIGRPCAGASLHLVDECRRFVPIGMRGEILIGGPGVANYQNALEITAERFIENLQQGHMPHRLYRSGDLARLRPDGVLVLEGRVDRQIKLHGRRIEPAEVECVLREIAGVADAAIILSHRNVLVAFVEPILGAILDTEVLRQRLSERLPIPMRPGFLSVLAKLPTTMSGKIDRDALRDLVDLPDARKDSILPRTAVEAALCRLLAEVVELECVGIDDDFIEIGGNSMRALQTVVRAMDMGFNLDVRDLFAYRTIRRIANAARLRSMNTEPLQVPLPFALVPSIERGRVAPEAEDAFPASSMQIGMIFEHAMAKDIGIYHDVFVYRIVAPANAKNLAAAAEHLAIRHPALRTCFDLGANPPLAVVWAKPVPLLTLSDLSAAEPAVQEAAMDAWVAAERHRGFNLTVPPLVRLHVIITGEHSFLLGVSFHHAVIDGWSDVTMLRELLEDYCALVRDEKLPECTPLLRGGALFVQMEQLALASKSSCNYWLGKLANRKQRPVASARSATLTIPVEIPANVSRALVNLAKTWRLPVKTLLLAAHMKVLAQVTGETEPVTAVVTGVRPELPNAHRMLGLFINTVPMQQAAAGVSWAVLAEALMSEELADYPHRRFPFAAMLEAGGSRPEALFYFTDYHNVRGLLHKAKIRLELIRTHEVSSFPIAANFAIDPFSEQVVLNLRVSETIPGAAQLAQIYQQALRSLSETPNEVFDGPALNSGSPSVRSSLVAVRFAAAAESYPQALALGWRDTRTTYNTLAQEVEGLSRLMDDAGLQLGDRVVLALPRKPVMVAAVLACLGRGYCFVPVDPITPRDRLAVILRESAPGLILTETDGPVLPSTDIPVRLASQAYPAQPSPPVVIEPESPAYLMFTSGSTGTPKGVLVSQSNLASLLAAIDVLCPPDKPAIYLALSSLSFDISLLELLWPLTHGGTVVLQEGPETWMPSCTPATLRGKGPDFSLFCFPPTGAGGVEQVVHLAKLVDDLGFKAVWVPERHFSAIGGDFPNPSVTAAALAVSTTRLEIRAGSLTLPLHHPVRVAEDWAQIDVLSHGRAGIAFARGWDARAMILGHGEPNTRVKAFFDDIETVRRLWRGGTVVGCSGEHLSLRPRPISPELKTWVAIASDAARWDRAAREDLGVLTHLLAQTPESLGEHIARYRAYGGRTDRVVLMLHAAVTEGEDEATAVRLALRRYLDLSTAEAENDLPDLNPKITDRRELLIERSLQRFSGACGLVGEAAVCIDRARSFWNAGVGEIACLVDFDTDLDRVITSIQRLDWVRAACAAASPVEIAPRRIALSIAENIATFGVSHLQCTPTIAAMLLRDSATKAALTRLDTIMVGGEALSASLATALSGVTDARLLNMYGPTEATIWSMASDFTGFDQSRGDERVTLGQALCNTRVHILDNTGSLADIGELCLAGKGLALGYVGDLVRTAERFVSRAGESRLYRTGDRVRRLPSGELEWLGRIDRQVKVAGRRLELGEIESLALSVPGVAGAVAAFDNEELTLIVTATPGFELTSTDVAAHLASHLPFSLIPSQITITNTAAMSVAGKFKPALSTNRCNQMLALWRECLKLNEVQPDDDFFTLGGTSISAVTLIARVGEAFNETLPLRSLFENPTPASLLARLGENQRTQNSRVSRLDNLDNESLLPLAPTQEQVWLSHAISPNSPTFNDAALLLLNGQLNTAALASALSYIVNRHESLRCSFIAKDGEIRQRIASTLDVVLNHLDASEFSNERLLEVFKARAREPFDLTCPPSARFTLATCAPDRFQLLVVIHHVACDGWGMAILVEEFILAYQAFAVGRLPTLEPAPSLRSFIQDQAERLSTAKLSQMELFWSKALKDANLEFTLTTDHSRLTAGTSDGAVHRFIISSTLTSRLVTLSKAAKVTEFMVLSTAFAVLLRMYTGAEDVIFGSDAAARPLAFRRLVASAANRIPLRFDLSGNPSFADLLMQARRNLPDAYDHQEMPLNYLAKLLQPSRPYGLHPLFQIALTLQEGEPLRRTIDEVSLTQCSLDYGIARLDLEINLQRCQGTIEGIALFRSDLFEPATIAGVCDRFVALLDEVSARPQARLSELGSRDGSPALIGTDRKIDQGSIIDQIQGQVAQSPYAVAISGEGSTRTYRDLAFDIDHLAASLTQQGVGPGRTVAVLADRTYAVPLSLLAILRTGATFILLGGTAPVARSAAMVTKAQCDFILADSVRAMIAAAISAEACGTVLIVEHLLAEPVLRPLNGVPVSEPAYICFTSGSTGTPKGAMVSHRGMRNHLTAKIDLLKLTAVDVVAQTSPETFDIYVWQVLAPLVAGAVVKIYDDELIRNPSELIRQISAAGVTVWEVVPSFLRSLLDLASAEIPLPRLRWLIVTGEALEPDLCRRWLARYPDIPMINAYGPVECSDDVAHYVINAPPGEEQARIPIGSPIANTRLHIWTVDGTVAPVGAVGELLISGDCVGLGYINDPERTTAAFIPDPANLAARLYRTGDRVRLTPSGTLEFLGRIDNQVKLRGHRIELEEVAVVIKRHPLVKDATVSISEEIGNRKLAAYFVIDDKAVAQEARVEAESSLRLANWQDVYNEAVPAFTDHDLFGLQIATWINSYDGQPIPRVEMQAWLDATLKRLIALPHADVLEIGVGSGMILGGLARDPETFNYIATDVSTRALELSRRVIASMGSSTRIELRRQPAHDFMGLAERQFDLVVLNSTVQYFPSADYLLTVLDQAVAVLKTGGRIFLGDVRNLSLLRSFHLSVLEKVSRGNTLATDLRARLDIACDYESELLIAPAFFESLRSRWPRLCRVEMQLKKTQDANELTRFRYDVVLAFDTATATAVAELDIGSNPTSTDLAAAAAHAPVRVVGLLNSRVARDVAAVARLEAADANQTLQDLQIATDPGGYDPAALHSWAESLGLACELNWSNRGPDRFDLQLYPLAAPLANRSSVSSADQVPASPANQNSPLTNAPLAAALSRSVEQDLRQYLSRVLPEAMIPTSFTRMKAIPYTHHGKLDRRALPHPSNLRPNLVKSFEPPIGTIETTISRLWSELLHIDKIGRHDDFFELGGDSIIVIQFVARARAEGLTLKPGDAFRRRTIAELAKACADAVASDLDIKSCGDAPTTPAQANLLRSGGAMLNHFNQALLLETNRVLNPEVLEQSLELVHARHEGLRLMFTPDGSRARSTNIAMLPLDRITHTAACLASCLAPLQAALDISTGQLWRAALIDWSSGRPPALALIAHHLAVDQVSWEIIVQDIETTYRALESGITPRLLPVMPFTRAAQDLAAKAAELSVLAQVDAWLGYPAVVELPRDLPGVTNGLSASSAILPLTLNAKTTQHLRGPVSRGLKAGLDQIVLAALLRALVNWTGQTAHTLTLEDSGRDGIDGKGANLSRSVGWFAAAWPAAFVLSQMPDPVADVMVVTQQARTGPAGITFGLLTEHHPDPEIRARLRKIGTTAVAYNFFGDIERSVERDRLFNLRPCDLGPLSGAENVRPNLLQIDGYLEDGQLHLRLEFSDTVHHRSTIKRLGDWMMKALNAIAEILPGAETQMVYDDMPDISLSDLAAAIAETGGD